MLPILIATITSCTTLRTSATSHLTADTLRITHTDTLHIIHTDTLHTHTTDTFIYTIYLPLPPQRSEDFTPHHQPTPTLTYHSHHHNTDRLRATQHIARSNTDTTRHHNTIQSTTTQTTKKTSTALTVTLITIAIIITAAIAAAIILLIRIRQIRRVI